MARALYVKCPEHLQAVRAFADAHLIRDRLQAALDYVKAYGDEGTIAFLYRDFGADTVNFIAEIFRRDSPGANFAYWLTMGIIYDERTKDWSTHT